MFAKILLAVSALSLPTLAAAASEAPLKPLAAEAVADARATADDPGALRTCQRHTLATYYDACLLIIRNRTFNLAALDACNRHNDAGHLNRCLEIVRDGEFELPIMELCNRHLDPS